MISNQINDLSGLCIHTITTKPWKIEEAAKQYALAGVKGITVWRDALEGRNIQKTGELLRDSGLSIVSLCRGGFFAHKEAFKRKTAVNNNQKLIEEAAELGAKLLVLVPGADPKQSLEDSRKQILDGITSVLPEAEAAGVKLAIEPLHPMYADTRSAINTMAQANQMAETLNSPYVGVAVDVYHLWWDPDLEKEIKRCGENNHLFAFHISDWETPTNDLLLDRGLMGEGCIPISEIKTWVEDAGFTGFHEVEIFSSRYWKQDQSEFLKKIIHAYNKII
jgi:sugar phosphate isomerase/epimerase